MIYFHYIKYNNIMKWDGIVNILFTELYLFILLQPIEIYNSSDLQAFFLVRLGGVWSLFCIYHVFSVDLIRHSSSRLWEHLLVQTLIHILKYPLRVPKEATLMVPVAWLCIANPSVQLVMPKLLFVKSLLLFSPFLSFLLHLHKPLQPFSFVSIFQNYSMELKYDLIKEYQNVHSALSDAPSLSVSSSKRVDCFQPTPFQVQQTICFTMIFVFKMYFSCLIFLLAGTFFLSQWEWLINKYDLQ